MTRIKHPTNKWERLQIEKKYREKETGNKAGRIRKTKFIQEQKEEDDADVSSLGYGAVPG